MTIHSEHPFADPASARDAVRSFRGRLPAGVTLWTAAAPRRPVGLTVSSVLVANGEPARLLALLDPLADLTEALLASGIAAVTLLSRDQRRLAEVFAGQLPAPGAEFEGFTESGYGPVPPSASAWAGVRLESHAPMGWSLLATCVIEHLEFGAETAPLLHYRGGYPRLA